MASSKISNAGSFITLLAIAILCFCPPESFTPLSPTSVSSFSGNVSGFRAKLVALAIFRAFSTFASDF